MATSDLPLGSPPAHGLVDGFGRRHTDLRISVTDRCNLRCTYCMPAEGVPWLPSPSLLTAEEIARAASVAVQMGVQQIRLTGGEPLLRPDIAEIVARLAALEPRPRIALTTNGMRLGSLARSLAAAGLDRVNVSLDTLDAGTFRTLARRDGLDETLGGLRAAAAAGLNPVKVNAVLMRGINDGEAVGLLRWALAEGYEMRFIEQMPLDPQHGWDRSSMVTAEEILGQLTSAYRLDAVEARGSAPAETWLVNGGPAVVGVIAAVTKPFCGACDRLRLTADGQIRNCLFASEELNLRDAMRAGADDGELVGLWQTAVARKRAAHGIGEPGFTQPDRPMSAIGG